MLCLQCVFLPPGADKSYTLYASMSCCRLSPIPEAPSRDADGHDDVGGHLREEDKEEDEEIEGAVTPEGEKREALNIPFKFGDLRLTFRPDPKQT